MLNNSSMTSKMLRNELIKVADLLQSMQKTQGTRVVRESHFLIHCSFEIFEYLHDLNDEYQMEL